MRPKKARESPAHPFQWREGARRRDVQGRSPWEGTAWLPHAFIISATSGLFTGSERKQRTPAWPRKRGYWYPDRTAGCLEISGEAAPSRAAKEPESLDTTAGPR